jgi:hypothetical protein
MQCGAIIIVTDNRQDRGRAIAEKPDQIMRLSEKFYRVACQSGRGMYNVTRTKASDPDINDVRPSVSFTAAALSKLFPS